MSRDYHLDVAKPYSPTVWVSFYTDYYTPGVENLYFQSTTYNYAPTNFTTDRRFGTASYDEILWKPGGSIDDWARFQWNGTAWSSSAVATGSGQAGMIPKGAEYQTQDKFVPSNTWGLPTRPGASDRWLIVKKSTGVAAPDPGQWTYYEFDYGRATLNYKPVAQGTVSGSVLDRIQFTADDGTVWADVNSMSVYTYSSVTGQWTQTSSTSTAMPSVDGVLEGTEWNSNKGYQASIAPPIPAPTNLRVIKPITETTIDLAWDAVISATSYKVYQATVAGGPYTLSTGTWLTTTDFRVTGLTKNTTYYFVVTALNGSLESPRSIEISRITMLPPLAPTVTNYSGLTATSITLSWDVSLNTDTYEIWQDTIADSYGFPVISGIVGTSYTITGLTPSTLYCFSIASNNMGGLSDLNSPFLNVTTLATGAPPPVPNVPTNLRVGTVSETAINLAWDVAPNATSYNVFKSPTTGGPWTSVATGITGTTYQVTGLIGSTAYFFTVSSVNTTGESAKSNEVNATTSAPPPPPPTPPSAPINFGVNNASISETSVEVHWDSMTGATSYSVYKSDTTGGPWTLVQSGVAQSPFTVTGLIENRTYFFTVTAVNAGGESPKSTEASAKTLIPLPYAPGNLACQSFTDTRAPLTWSSGGSYAYSYNVYKSATSGGPWTLVTSGIVPTSYTIQGLTPSTVYYFAVSSVNPRGESAKSPEITMTTSASVSPMSGRFYPINNAMPEAHSFWLMMYTSEPHYSPDPYAGTLVNNSGVITDFHRLARSQTKSQELYLVCAVSDGSIASNAPTRVPFDDNLDRIEIMAAGYPSDYARWRWDGVTWVERTVLNGMGPYIMKGQEYYSSKGLVTDVTEATKHIFSGGIGVTNDPYIISTAADLNAVRLYRDAVYKMVNDIDIGGAPYGSGEGWLPIPRFQGYFNANGFKVKNLYVNKPHTATDHSCSLFLETASYARIKNLALSGVNITSEGRNIVPLVGYMWDFSVVDNCYAEGTINGNDYEGYDGSSGTIKTLGSGVAGLIGTAVSSTSIIGSHFEGTLNVGPLGSACGFILDGMATEIHQCYAKGRINGGTNAAGFIGTLPSLMWHCYADMVINANNDTIIPFGGYASLGRVGGFCLTIARGADLAQCYAKGSVSAGNQLTGGFAAFSTRKVRDCYADVTVSGTFMIGGFCAASGILVPSTTPEGSFENCHAVGIVGTTAQYSGGFLGGAIDETYGNSVVLTPTDYRVTNCFYDSQMTGKTDTGKGTPKLSSEMKTQSIFTGWDFTNVWVIKTNGLYPVFIWSGAPLSYHQLLFTYDGIATRVIVAVDTNIVGSIPIYDGISTKYILTAKLPLSPVEFNKLLFYSDGSLNRVMVIVDKDSVAPIQFTADDGVVYILSKM